MGDNVQIPHTIALVDKIVDSMLHGKGVNRVQAMKVTQRGIYTYNTLEYVRSSGAPVLKDEVTIYEDSEGFIPLKRIIKYIENRPRVKQIKTKDSYGLRVVISEPASFPKTPEVEKETTFDSALYLFARDLYEEGSSVGKRYCEKYKVIPGVGHFDAKMFLVEQQLKTLEDTVLYTLYRYGYLEGLYDSHTGILYGKDKNGKMHNLATFFNKASEGVQVISFKELGVRYEVKTSSTEEGAGRSTRFFLPNLTIELDAVEHFKDIKDIKKGIILVNTVMPDNLINTIYYHSIETAEAEDEDLRALECAEPKDILVLEHQPYCTNNPYIIQEPLKKLTPLEISSGVIKMQDVIDDAISTGYSVIIARGVNYLTDRLLKAADTSLIFIIDDFNSINDVQQKFEGSTLNTKLIVNKVIGIMDISKITYLSMNRTLKSIIYNLNKCGSKIQTTSYIKVDESYKNFNSFIFECLKKENLDRILINKSGILLSYLNKDKEEIITTVTFNNMLCFLAGLTDENIYEQLRKDSMTSMLISIDDDKFRLSTYMENEDITIIIKKLCETGLDSNIVLPDIDTSSNHIKKGNIHYILKGTGNVNINQMAVSLLNEKLKEGELVLLIDEDYSINTDTIDPDLQRRLEVTRLGDERKLYDIVTARKPTLIILHRLKSKTSLESIYNVASLVPNIIVTSKYEQFSNIYLNFIEGNIKSSLDKYHTDQYYYTTIEENGLNYVKVDASNGEVVG